jgi:hypothetical protein
MVRLISSIRFSTLYALRSTLFSLRSSHYALLTTLFSHHSPLYALRSTLCTLGTKHISNIFKENELVEKGNVHFLHSAISDKPVKLYSLDATEIKK